MSLISKLMEEQDELAARRTKKYDVLQGDALDRLDQAIADAVDFLIDRGMRGPDAVKAVVGHLNDVVTGYDLERGSMEEEEDGRAAELRRIMQAERERQARDKAWRKKMAETPKRKAPPPREPSPEELRQAEEFWKSYGEERARAKGVKWTGD